MELSASSYQSSDPYHGGDGYRPTINAYQFGDAQAISTLAGLNGDLSTRPRFTIRAERLSQAQGLYGLFGPTTVERRSPWFMFDAATGCCHWDGPMWPYAASQTLTGMANLLIDYPPQRYVTKNDYYNVLSAYAFAQQKNGQPYVAEAHDPDNPVWIYDSFNHSEDYNHSTFNDLVLSGLLGIRPQLTDTVIVHPLVPDSWDYFAIENLPYHGRNLTVVWDKDGSHYHQGAGLRIYVDGQLTAVRDGLQPVQARVSPILRTHPLPRLVNDAVNAFGGPTQPAEFPKASASYTSPYDDAQRAIDGENFYLDIPNTRWTSYLSPNPTDWWSVDFGQLRPVSDVRIYFYNDNGGAFLGTQVATRCKPNTPTLYRPLDSVTSVNGRNGDALAIVSILRLSSPHSFRAVELLTVFGVPGSYPLKASAAPTSRNLQASSREITPASASWTAFSDSVASLLVSNIRRS